LKRRGYYDSQFFRDVVREGNKEESNRLLNDFEYNQGLRLQKNPSGKKS